MKKGWVFFLHGGDCEVEEVGWRVSSDGHGDVFFGIHLVPVEVHGEVVAVVILETGLEVLGVLEGAGEEGHVADGGHERSHVVGGLTLALQVENGG